MSQSTRCRIVCIAVALIALGAETRRCHAAAGGTARDLQPASGGLASVVDAPARGGDHRWRPSPDSVELPTGDPLTESLDFSPAERDLFIDAADGSFDEHTLIDAALVACGADGAAIVRCRGRFADLAKQLRHTTIRVEESQKIELIHSLLHERLLRNYDADATDLVGAFDRGVYNCASATLLFVALAGEVNLKAAAVELPGHVRAVVACAARLCEIEVTCPEWPAAAHSRSVTGDMGATGSASAKTGAGVSNPSPFQGEGRVRVAAPSTGELSSGRSRRDITSPGLVAMIYYNRGIDAFYEHRFADAVAANRRALVLDPDSPVARGNLLAAANNWALALCEAGHYQAAEALLAAGRRFAPGHAPFAHNAAHVERMRAHAAVANP